MKQLVLIGTGGLARETLWAIPDGRALGFVTCDAADHGTRVSGLPVLGPESWLIGREDVVACCCIGDPRGRRRVVESLSAEGVEFQTVAHPSAEISPWVELSAGCLIGARAVLTTQVRIGPHAVIGVGATVSHDCALGAFATLAPGVQLAGGVQIGDGAELGVGAVARPGAKIGRGARVGAGATVIEDVVPNVVAVGTPARPVRTFPSDAHF